jgi:hypothetical protein
LNIFLLINDRHLTNVFLAWFDLIYQQGCTSAFDHQPCWHELLAGCDGSIRTNRTPRELIFWLEAMKKESIIMFILSIHHLFFMTNDQKRKAKQT